MNKLIPAVLLAISLVSCTNTKVTTPPARTPTIAPTVRAAPSMNQRLKSCVGDLYLLTGMYMGGDDTVVDKLLELAETCVGKTIRARMEFAIEAGKRTDLVFVYKLK